MQDTLIYWSVTACKELQTCDINSSAIWMCDNYGDSQVNKATDTKG